MKSILNKLFKIFTILVFIIMILLSIGTSIILYNASNAIILLKTGYKPIKFYDNLNNLISTSSYYYEFASLNDISKNIINAFIATEDKNFYKHNGYSFPSIVRAIYTNLANKNYSVGASTITQQYVKNAFLTNEKTISRKINEIAYAIMLEEKYTKDQILEAYLNSILFGGNIYGINMATKYYFGKDPNNVSISEAAYLAGLIQAPNKYNAYYNPTLANERKNFVLKRMLEEEYITKEEYNKEIKIDIQVLLNDKVIQNNDFYYSSYLDYIYGNLTLDKDTITDVYTHLDTNIQTDLYKIITNEYKLFNDDNLNCAIVVLDNSNYGIKALVGNRATDKRVLNYATDIKLQPGSTIKPILDYAPAIEYLSYTPATIIKDEEYYYSDGNKVNNYDHKYKGDITLRSALKDSRNVPAVKLFKEVGANRAYEFAEKIGITASDRYEANAIGGATHGYTLLSLANAYQAFANLGYYKKATGIKKIVYDTYTKYNDETPRLVMKPTTAWLINNILHDVFKYSSYNIKKTYLMAKTGQTNYDEATRKKYKIPSSASKDSLLIAYTKDLTIGIWIGYNKIEKGLYLDSYKKTIPRSIMKIILEKYAKSNQYYDIIDGITKKYITIENGKAYLTNDNGYYEYFESGTEPTSYVDKLNKV